MRTNSVIVAARRLATGALFVPAALAGQAVSVGGGIGSIGVSPSGYVGQLSVSYDAPLRGRSLWWAGVQVGRDANPGVASPGVRQSVSEMIVSVGPLVPVQLSPRAKVFIGAGGYGVVRRYGEAQSIRGGPALTAAGSGGGDWGALGRAGLLLEVRPRWSVVFDSQLRVAVEGSERRKQPAFSVGLRRQW